MLIKDGKNTLFWKDSCQHDKPLCTLFPDLLKICNQQNISVWQVKNDLQVVTFTRWLVDNMKLDWLNILKDLNDLALNNKSDTAY